MAEFTLYCFAQSGNAYKAALMLNLCGADWKPEFVDFFKGGSKTPEFLKLNPMGEIPVLLHKDEMLSQSGVILDYLSDYFGQFGYKNDAERREIMRWILFDNHKLTASIATLRYLLRFAKTGETDVTGFLRGRADAALAVLEDHLEQRHFILGDDPTIADFSLCGYLFWPEEFGKDWHDHKSIANWLARIRKLPGWVHPYELMPGHPLD